MQDKIRSPIYIELKEYRKSKSFEDIPIRITMKLRK